MDSGSAPEIKDYFSDLELPSVQDMSLQLEKLVQQGTLSPEQAQAMLVERSAMEDVSQDSGTRQAQMDALLGLQDITSSGGLTSLDKSRLNQIQSDEQARERGSREAIMSGAQERGMGSSGMNILAQLQNAQDSATRQSTRDLDVAGMAQDRALQALMQQGQLAGNIGQQQFSQDASKAGAQDAIAQFNAANRQNVNFANTLANNQAQGANLAMKQDIANQNVGTRNQQQIHNKSLIQQNYENELKKRQGQAGIASQNASNAFAESQGAANANNQMIGTGITAAGYAFGGPAGGMAANTAVRSQGKANGGLIEGEPADYDNMMTPTMSGEFVVRKEDVPDFLKKAHTDDDGEFDAAGFLDSITGHKYNYKGKK